MKSRFLLAAILLSSVSFKPAWAEEFSQGKPQYNPLFFISKKEYLWIIKGREFANSANYPKALELFERAIKANPKSTAYYWMGLTHEHMVYDILKKWTELQKADPAGRPHLDESTVKKHQESAVESYRKAAESFPNVDYIQYQFAKATLEYTADLSTAIEYFLKAISLNTEEMLYRTELARAYMEAKNFPEARKEAETALTDRRTVIQSEAHALLGEIELEQKNVTKAVEELKLSLSLNPGLYLSHYYLGKAYQWNQQFEKALDSHYHFLTLFSPSTLKEAALFRDASREYDQLTNLEKDKKVLRH